MSKEQPDVVRLHEDDALLLGRVVDELAKISEQLAELIAAQQEESE
jgi:hypothetical protein